MTGADETVPRLSGQVLADLLHRRELILRESAIFGIPRSRPRASTSTPSRGRCAGPCGSTPCRPGCPGRG
ncbi:hypothetical protein ACRBEV_19365 [Methylobacterium phyllosphaerae]